MVKRWMRITSTVAPLVVGVSQWPNADSGDMLQYGIEIEPKKIRQSKQEEIINKYMKMTCAENVN